MSNFAFLQAEWPELYQTARRVEQYVQSDPRSACFYGRRALEQTLHWLYAHDPAFRTPYDDTLAALLNDDSFRDNVPHAIYTKAQYLRKVGNQAVHDRKKIPAQLALGTAVELHHILYWLARTYTTGDPTAIPGQFDETRLPIPAAKIARQSIAQLQALDKKLQAQDEALRRKEAENEALRAQLTAALQAQVAAQKAANETIPDSHDYSEAETRQRYIDVLLREAGWDPHAAHVAEYPVTGMPYGRGSGKVDYVLWGDDGLPLGLVEAKRTSADPYKGKQQAKLYADCLEQMHGQRPIIFYTNGYQTWLWDDARYPPRPVQGFYTKDELALLIQRRTLAQPLAAIPLNTNIINRYYQEEAIRHLAEQFSQNRRKGLLVMATGTGKTRVAIALVDMLMRAGWVKRTLFLADRSALVRQAAKAFKSHLPASNPVNLTESGGKEQAASARVVVSTYHTMMNLIDAAQADGQKLFSVGHFDLVIIDEAHRSVYQKFGAIFHYFDSLLVGLTATPKDEVDRNTYQLFELEDGVPTYAYHLDTAVDDHYLVPYRAYEMTTRFLREGITYNDLSDAEKAEWDLLDWGDSEEIPDKIQAAALNNWLFNADTVDHILKSLMEHGLKVAGGDRLGKTIIFAQNQKHARFIEERFDVHYPHEKGGFARVIVSSLNYAQDLIDQFSKPQDAPHIAISVDMLDTGVDVPEVVNLVFFKIVRSKTKFFQMIGRGTRLRPDLFGPGADKTHFLIFDACQNFEFFNQNPKGVKESQPEPLSQRLFKTRLALLEQTRRLAATDPALAPLATDLADALHSHVAHMNLDNFIVRPQRQYVEPFQERARWHNLSRTDAAQLAHYVSGLPTQQPEEEETAKQFDLLTLQLQLAHLEGAARFPTLRDKIIDIAANLETKSDIPRVRAQLDFIHELQTERYWQGITLPMMEEIRQRLRSLTVHVDPVQRQELYTAFTDEATTLHEVGSAYMTTGVNVAQYKRKVEQFLRDHEDYWAVQKIRWGIPLEPQDLKALEAFFYQAEEIGGQEQFVQVYGRQENLAAFIRSLVGLDRGKAKERFAQFLDGRAFTADQIRFVNYIIDHLTANGAIDPGMLYGQPYTAIHAHGLDGVFPGPTADKLLAVVRSLNVVVKTNPS